MRGRGRSLSRRQKTGGRKEVLGRNVVQRRRNCSGGQAESGRGEGGRSRRGGVGEVLTGCRKAVLGRNMEKEMSKRMEVKE